MLNSNAPSLRELMQPLAPETERFLQRLNVRENDQLAIACETSDFDELILAPFARNANGDLIRASWRADIERWLWRLPEGRRLSGNRIKVPATDFTICVVESIWGRDRISFADSDAELIFNYWIAAYQSGLRRTKIQADYKTQKIIPAHELELHSDPEKQLANYQVAAALCAIGSEGYALFMEQGTGKTPVVISRIDQESIQKQNQPYLTIIVCPKQVRMNWQSELQKFSIRNGSSHVLRGNKLQRVKTICEAVRPFIDSEDDFVVGYGAKNWSVVVMSYGLMWRSMGILQQVPWDLAVLDESHSIKNPLSKQGKGAIELRDASKARMCLTGTPYANHLGDLYNQLEFLGKGFSGFSNYKKFRAFYSKTKIINGQEIFVGLQNVPFMKERLARLGFVISLKEARPELPAKLYDIYDVEMSPRQREVYKKVAEEVITEIEEELASALDTKKAIIVNNTLTRLLRLSEITSGYAKYTNVVDIDGEYVEGYEEGGEKKSYYIERFDPNPKLEALIEILKDKTSTQKTIVWAHFVQDIKTISARLQLEGIEAVTYYGATSDKQRAENEFRFNTDPNVKVFIGNAATAGAGLNLLGHGDHIEGHEGLQTSCDHTIYFSQDYSSLKRAQSEGRAHRIGVRQEMQITDLCVLGTVDQTMREIVTNKRLAAMELQDLHELLHKVTHSLNNL